MESPTEIVKAGGEIAKVFSPLTENLAKLTGPLCDELGEYFGDKVRAFRLRNTTVVIEGSVKQLEDAGKPVNAVPPRLLLPILDAASVEGNPMLQEMWIGLLASASDQADQMSPSFGETLKNLTPMEACGLKSLYDDKCMKQLVALGSDDTVHRVLRRGLKTTDFMAPYLVLESLERLGLLKREYGLNPAAVESIRGTDGLHHGAFEAIPPPDLIYEREFTSYGIRFMEACQGPQPTKE